MSKCGAPCIFNTSIGFRLVFCGKDRGHEGNHSCEIPDHSQTPYEGTQGTVHWSYTGNTAGETGVSSAGSVHQRCGSWVHSQEPLKLESGRKEDPGFHDPLFRLLAPDGHRSAFCCEKKPGHDGAHTRSGIFSPLGMKWRITW